MTVRKFLYGLELASQDDSLSKFAPVLQQVVRNAAALLLCDHCSVALVDDSGSALVTLAALNVPPEDLWGSRFAFDEGVAGWVALHRVPLSLDHASSDPRFKRLGSLSTGSILCVPLLYEDILLGTLTVSSPVPAAFSSSHTRTLAIFADQAALMIAQLRQQGRALAQRSQLDALLSLSQSLLTCSDPDDVYSIVLTEARTFVPYTSAYIYRYREQTQELLPVAAWSSSSTAENGRVVLYPAVLSALSLAPLSLYASESISARAALHRQPVFVPSSQFAASSSASFSTLVVPLLSHNLLCGVPTFERLAPFRDEDLRLLQYLASAVAVVLENCELLQRVGTDNAAVMKTNFLSMITHELRSPLNAINGYLELVLEGVSGELNVQQHEFIQRARAGSEHLYSLLEDLFLISRADAGQLRLSREVLILADVVDAAVDELELTAADCGVLITVHVPSDLPRLYADGIRLQQVLRNLLNNALRFTPSGGRVAISATLAHASLPFGPTVSLDDERRLIKLQVRDSGVGIAPEFQQRIFERFFQVPDPDALHSGGQGLGLAIVKMITELHGGSVTVESVSGEGSTFTCNLPCL